MGLFSAAADFVGDVGFSVIKNSGRIALGGGKAVLGLITEDEELIGEGIGQAGKGAIYLGASVIGKQVFDDDDDSDSLFDGFDE